MQSIAWKLYTSKKKKIDRYSDFMQNMSLTWEGLMSGNKKKCFDDHLQYIKCELAHIISSAAILIWFVFCKFLFGIGNYHQQKKKYQRLTEPETRPNPMRIIYSKSKWSRRERTNAPNGHTKNRKYIEWIKIFTVQFILAGPPQITCAWPKKCGNTFVFPQPYLVNGSLK